MYNQVEKIADFLANGLEHNSDEMAVEILEDFGLPRGIAQEMFKEYTVFNLKKEVGPNLDCIFVSNFLKRKSI